ncbi:MAG: endonuclease [Nanoarchaeota archaeon]
MDEKELMQQYGTTYAEEAGFTLRNTPSPLFKLLVLSILLSARIRAENAVRAARALFKEGLTTPQKMADATWRQRVTILNQNGYARYDEKTSRMLGENARMLLDRYAGDLRNLRQAAQRIPDKEKELLKEFKGIGDVGADIFFREVQAIWDELYPFLGKKAAQQAQKMDIDTGRINKDDYPRLAAALVRKSLE